MKGTTIVIGWYKKKPKRGKTTEEKRFYKGSNMADTSPEIAKRVVAMELGYKYPEEIDFEYFDRSCDV